MDLTPVELFLSNIHQFFSHVFSAWIDATMFGILFDEHPILYVLVFGMPIVGFVVGLFRRLKNA